MCSPSSKGSTGFRSGGRWVPVSSLSRLHPRPEPTPNTYPEVIFASEVNARAIRQSSSLVSPWPRDVRRSVDGDLAAFDCCQHSRPSGSDQVLPVEKRKYVPSERRMIEGSCVFTQVPEQAPGLAYPLTRVGRRGRKEVARIFRLNMGATILKLFRLTCEETLRGKGRFINGCADVTPAI